MKSVKISRSPLGGRGLKRRCSEWTQSFPRRSPLGGRGLKLEHRPGLHNTVESLPSRGAWIETKISVTDGVGTPVAPLSGGVD